MIRGAAFDTPESSRKEIRSRAHQVVERRLSLGLDISLPWVTTIDESGRARSADNFIRQSFSVVNGEEGAFVRWTGTFASQRGRGERFCKHLEIVAFNARGTCGKKAMSIAMAL